MKRICVYAGLVCLCVLAVCGCKKKDNEKTELMSDVHKCGGSVVVGQYKGISYTKAEPVVSDAEVEKMVQQMLAIKPNYVPDETKKGAVVKKGDLINLDFVGKVGGVAFDGGSAKDFLLQVGEGGLIDGFEEGIIGAKVGETRDIAVTFPDPYSYDTALSGAKAVFTVTVNYFVTESKEVTEEYVKKYSDTYSSVEEFYASVRESLMGTATEEANTATEAYIMSKVLENSQFTSIDQADVDYYYQKLYNPYVAYAEQKSLSLEEYLNTYTVYESVGALEEACRTDAEDTVRQFMVLQKIAEIEGISLTEEEYQAYLVKIKDMSGYATVDIVEALYGSELLTYNAQMEKTYDYIIANAILEQ